MPGKEDRPAGPGYNSHIAAQVLGSPGVSTAPSPAVASISSYIQGPSLPLKLQVSVETLEAG